MTLYASKTPRDLNHDPEPWVEDMGIVLGTIRHTERGVDTEHSDFYLDPRPKFDHEQHNEPNPILVEFRALAEKHGMAPDEVRVLARSWIGRFDYFLWMTGTKSAKKDAHAHARRVLIRLASLVGTH